MKDGRRRQGCPKSCFHLKAFAASVNGEERKAKNFSHRKSFYCLMPMFHFTKSQFRIPQTHIQRHLTRWWTPNGEDSVRVWISVLCSVLASQLGHETNKIVTGGKSSHIRDWIERNEGPKESQSWMSLRDENTQAMLWERCVPFFILLCLPQFHLVFLLKYAPNKKKTLTDEKTVGEKRKTVLTTVKLEK